MSALDPDDKPLSYVPLDELTTPKSGRVIVDGWWAVHPQRGAIFYGPSPQYNTDKRVTEKLQPELYPWAEIQLIPLAFMHDHDRRHR